MYLFIKYSEQIVINSQQDGRVQASASDVSGLNISEEQVITYSDDIMQRRPSLDRLLQAQQQTPPQEIQPQQASSDEIHKISAHKSSLADEMINWKQWFKEFQFYRYGLAYTGVRLYCNVSSTMITFYLITVLKFQKENSIQTPIEIALIPLSLYLMSAVTSSILDKIYKLFGKKWTFTVGALLCGGTSVSLLFLTPETKNYMYAVAPIIGIAQAINLNTGITLISDVIGLRGSSGAFVFGFYSFLDKISSGVVLFLCTNSSHFKESDYVRWVLVLVPSVSCLFAWILVVMPVDQPSEDQLLVNDTDQEYFGGRKRLDSLQDELVS